MRNPHYCFHPLHIVLNPAKNPRWLDPVAYLIICLILFADALLLIGDAAAAAPTAPGLTLDRGIVVAGLIALLIFGYRGWRSGELITSSTFGIGATCGLILFAGVIGSAIADPRAIEWLLRGDWATHYAGWATFRNTPWTWPPGAQPNVMYPVGSSILYSDSLPLLALLGKPFTAWLPEPFQYSGLWLASCFVLHGAFAALLVRRWTSSPAAIIAGTVLFLYAPVFLCRLGHITLMAQWEILAALWLYFRTPPARSTLAEAWPWWLLLAIAALDMPYLAMQVFAVFVACWIRRCQIERARPRIDGILVVATGVVLMIALWWLCGAWIIRFKDGSGGVPYGRYSLNLLSWFNPMGISRLIPSWPLPHPDQYEGFAWLGIGVLGLLAVLGVEASMHRRRPHWPREHWPLAIIVLATIAFAASTVLVIGPWTLIDLPIKSPLLATFRASGRFVWLSYYLIVLGAVVFTLRRFRAPVALALLILAFAAHAWDFAGTRKYDANLRSGFGWPKPEQTLTDPRWDELAAGRKHVTLVPPNSCGVQPGSYLPFQLLAARHGMSLNSGYVNRWDPKAENEYCRQLVRQLADGDLHEDELYVVGDDWLERFGNANRVFRCEMLDGYRACVLPLKQK